MDSPQQTATVTVMPGGVNLETVATFTNYAAPPGSLKICKIAGAGVDIGTPFTFTASDGTTIHRDTVNAGPPPGGNCVIDGTWPVNDPVTVTETFIPTGVSVSNITVEPPDRGGPPDLQHGKIVVTIGSGFTEVDFTDSSISLRSCVPSSSMSVLINGSNVVSSVPLANWFTSQTGIHMVQIEPTAGIPVLIPTLHATNSCASNSVAGKTVCVANQKPDVYLIVGTSLTPLTSGATAPITKLSGSGNCLFAAWPWMQFITRPYSKWD